MTAVKVGEVPGMVEFWATEAYLKMHARACQERDDALERSEPVECPPGHYRRFYLHWMTDPVLLGISDAEFRRFVDRLPAVRDKRKAVSHADRGFILARDGHACVVCGATDDLEIDHIVPHSRGGVHDRTNFQTLCRRCNASKRDKTMDEWLGVS